VVVGFLTFSNISFWLQSVSHLKQTIKHTAPVMKHTVESCYKLLST